MKTIGREHRIDCDRRTGLPVPVGACRQIIDLYEITAFEPGFIKAADTAEQGYVLVPREGTPGSGSTEVSKPGDGPETGRSRSSRHWLNGQERSELLI